MYNVDLRLEAYEVLSEGVSGFKAFKGNELIGTLEKRNSEWIGAVTSGIKIITFQHIDLEFVLNKMNKLGGYKNE